MIEWLLGPQEFYERMAGRFFGKYKAVVKDTADPQRLGRVRVLCEPVYGNDLSPWADLCNAFPGSVDTGSFFVPPLDSLVFIEFEQGLKEFPIVAGGFYSRAPIGRTQDGSPIEASAGHQGQTMLAPLHAQGLPDGSDFDGTSKGTPGVPRSNFAGQYPHVRVIRTPSGHMLEFDDTEENERVQILHSSGAHIEILPDGSINIISEGAINKKSRAEKSRVDGSKREAINGSFSLDIAGDFNVNIGGSYNLNLNNPSSATIRGETLEVNGDDIRNISGNFFRTATNNVNVQAGGDSAFGAVGNMNIQAGGVGSLIFSNSLNIPNPIGETLTITGQVGKTLIRGTDPTGFLAQYGIEIQPLGTTPPLTPVKLPGSIGPHIFLGNLLAPPTRGPAGVPLIQENLVLGQTLIQYLTQLQGFLSAWFTDYLTHIHPTTAPGAPTTPPISAAIFGPTGITQLTTLLLTYLTPLPPNLTPLMLSDIVFTSKQ